MTSKYLKFVIVIVAVILLRIADLTITYLYTPTLSNELNPLVSLGNLSWYGLLVSQIILSLIIALCWAFYNWGKIWAVEKNNLKYSDYIYYYFFDKIDPWVKRFFRFPKHVYPHVRLLTFVITMTSLIISVFAIINNLLLIIEFSTYEQFLISSASMFFPSVLLFAIFASANLFFILEYKQYKHTQ